ncbi:MAG: ribonuclease R, partial [Ruminococcus sp.]|nr:ribonuclease R [Ruminococcus sp.]
MSEKPKKKQTAKKSGSPVSVESYKNKIVTFLKAYGKKSMPLSELESKCRTKKSGRENFTEAFSQLRTEGVVMMKKGMKAALCSRMNVYPGT